MQSILHLTHTSVPNDARILRELNALSRVEGMEVRALGIHEPTGALAQVGVHLEELDVRSFRANWLPRPLRYALALLEINVRYTARILSLRPDVVHCHDTMVLPSGMLAKILGRATVIYDAHELESDKAGQTPSLSKATLWIERLCWPHVDALITVSPAISSWYVDHLGSKPTLCVLNSPAVSQTDSGGRPDATEDGIRAQLGLARDARLFVYVGALETGRGIELLLRVFTEPSQRAHIAFIGAGTTQGNIQQAACDSPNIHYCHPVPHADLVAFIKDADGAFCLIEDVSLSDHYCLPNKLFEYAFAGIPVIASRLPEISRVVSQYDLGICVDLNEDSISEAIRASQTHERPSISGRLNEVSWARQAEHLRDLYSRLLGSR